MPWLGVGGGVQGGEEEHWAIETGPNTSHDNKYWRLYSQNLNSLADTLTKDCGVDIRAMSRTAK